MEAARTPFQVTVSVWRALFLREAVQRLFGSRAAWLWLLLEPLVHVVFLMFIFTITGTRMVGGIDSANWLMVGLLTYFMFKRSAMQCQGAVGSNHALFTYRQVKPVDTVLVRAGLEGFLMILSTVLLVTGVALLGLGIVPADPLAVLEALFGMWAAGLGFGLMASVARELIPELGKIIGMLMTPLYFLSGIMLPVTMVPPAYREWLMFNPLIHGVEAARLAFAPYYQTPPELNISYLHGFALITVFLGLALHARFATRLTTQ